MNAHQRVGGSRSLAGTMVGIMLMLVLALVVAGTLLCPVPAVRRWTVFFDPEAVAHLPHAERVRSMRTYNFARLRHIAYLDWARRAPFPDSLIDNFTRLLQRNLYGNTHSESESSERSMDVVDDLRRRIIHFLGTNLGDYFVVFTLSQTQALKTIIEAFPFTRQSKFMYSLSSNNDALGLRGIATGLGAQAECFEGVPKTAALAGGP